MSTTTWKVIAGISVLALLALVGLVATIAFAGPSNSQFAGWGHGGLMQGYGGSGMGGYNGMMGPGFGQLSDVDPVPVNDARTAVEGYLNRLDESDLAVGEVMVFANHAYAQVVEKSTGIGAFEVLVDPVTQAVTPEPGPNMMWNLKYGHMAGFGMMGGFQGSGMGMRPLGMGGFDAPDFSGEMPVSPEEAIQTAQRYLDAYLPGTQAADKADPFYGYSTIHVIDDGETMGMLSVNGYSKEVFVHFWHGDFVDMADEIEGASLPQSPTQSGTVWVANNGSNDVSVIEESTGQVIARIPAGKVPHNVTVGQTLAYVPNSGDNSVTLIDLSTYRPVAVVEVGAAPHDVALTPDETLAFVTNMGSSSVSVIDVPSRRVVKTLEVGAGPAHSRASPDGSLVYVANSGSGNISIIDTASLQVLDTIPTGQGTHNVVVTPDGKAALVTLSSENGVVRVELQSRQVGEVLATGPAPHNLALSPDGSRLYVANTGASTVTTIAVPTWEKLGEFDVSRDAHGVLLGSTGEKAFVSNRGAASVSVLDLQTGQVVAVIVVGVGPDGLFRGPQAPTGLPSIETGAGT